MLPKHLTDILGRLGFTRDGAAHLAPAGHTASVYLERGQEALIIDNVQKVELAEEIAIISTARTERYGAELADICAVRVVADRR